MKKCVFYEITTVVSVYIFILIYTEKVFSKKQCMNIAYKNKLSHDCRVRTERMKVRFNTYLGPSHGTPEKFETISTVASYFPH